MGIHKIKLGDLTPLFFQQLREQYLDKDLDVEIKVYSKKLNESLFWEIIALFDWTKKGDDQAVLAPAIAFLSDLEIKEIKAFQDILSEKLFLLDGEKYATEIGQFAYGKDFSVDIFLYARCCVIANGKACYEKVLRNPKAMIKDLTFEPLLSLAAKAYELKTGKELEYVPAFNYETFFNSEGWGKESLVIETKY